MEDRARRTHVLRKEEEKSDLTIRNKTRATSAPPPSAAQAACKY